jgi:ABC-type transport system involved in multi-copper enzyme maturation permease subunit
VVAGLLGVPWPFVGTAALVLLGILVSQILGRWAICWVGPLCLYDLARLARRGGTIRLRCYYALLLLVAFYFIYVFRFPDYDPLDRPFDPGVRLSLQQQAEFGGKFVTAVLLFQSAAVLVLTPAYLAGAVAEEKERRTLELLLTTHLNDREIVLGKLFGRLGHLGIFMLTGAPILMLVQLFGGVDFAIVLSSFVVTAMSLLSAGSLSILCSVMARRVITALLTSYAFCFLLFGCLLSLGPIAYVSCPAAFVLTLVSGGQQVSPGSLFASGGVSPTVAYSGRMHLLWPMLMMYVLVHGSLAFVYAGLAVVRMRHVRRREQRGPRPSDPLSEEEALPESPVPPAEAIPQDLDLPGSAAEKPILLTSPPEPESADRWYDPPPVGERPFLWKEVYLGASINSLYNEGFFTILWIAGLLAALVVAGDFLCGYLNDADRIYGVVRTALDPFLRGLAVFLAAVWCVFLAFRAASSIGRERDRRTLDLLLTLPVERQAILGAKWVGTILRCRFLGYFLAVLWAFGLLTGTFHPVAVLFLAVACAAHVAFFTSLGTSLGLVCRKTVVAHMALALVLLALFTLPWLMAAGAAFVGSTSSDEVLAAPASPADGGHEFYLKGLNPGWTTWALGFSWEELGSPTGPYRRQFLITERAALRGVALYAVLAGALWLLACRHFRRSARPARKARLVAPTSATRVRTDDCWRA